MSDLAAAAEKLGLPEALVERSAEARAEATGSSVDDILAAWAGGEGGPATPAPAADAPEPEPAAEEAEGAVEPEPAPEPAAVVPAAEAAPVEPGETVYREVEYLPTPETVAPDEALEWEQVTTIRTAGLKEKTRVSVPSWLVALFILVPTVAVFLISFNAEGFACGEGGQLTVDWAGNLANCDGTAFEAGGAGGGGELTVAFGEGQEIYTAQCASCHGDGGGGGVGPALSGGAVVGTFPACSDHTEWVLLGSNGWPDSTYGANGTPVAGGMPGFANLSEEELDAVVFFERVQFGQEPLEDAGANCGLVEEGEGGGEGEESEGDEAEGGEESGDEAGSEGESEDTEG